jgi:hypothetical protein
VDIDHATKARINSVTLLAIHRPTRARVMNMGGPAMAFGAVGGLAQGSMDTDNTNAFVKALNEKKVSFTQHLGEPLIAALEKEGYKVTYNPKLSPKNDDAILNVWYTTIGYVSPPSSTSYIPSLGVKARLLDARTKKELYFRMYTGGYEWPVENAVNIPAADKYQYQSFSSLMENIDQAFEGILESQRSIAARIAKDLAKK